MDSKAVYRPQSPAKVSWFEFLLNPALLEQHLSVDSPDPSATELIISFLSNCPSSVNENNISNNNGNKATQMAFGLPLPPEEPSIEDIEMKEEEQDTKKSRALKLLSLKAATILKWDLNLLEKQLPLNMQYTLLLELLKITGNELKGSDNTLIRVKDLNPDAAFACLLFNLWVLHAVVEGSNPTKGSRGSGAQIPGQTDPFVVSPIIMENIMKKVHEETEAATSALEDVGVGLKMRLPVLSSFGSIADEQHNPTHRWEDGQLLDEDEVICQVSYDLGSFYFFHERYEDASKHFIRATELYPKFKASVFCSFPELKLKGFYTACAYLLGYKTHDANTSLKEVLQMSSKAGHQDTIRILKNDNIKRELPLSLRDAAEINILQEHSGNIELLLYVTFLNVLRRTVDGQVLISDWWSLLKNYEEKSALIFCELLKDIIQCCSAKQKVFLKNFVKTLCLASITAKLIFRKTIMSLLLSADEVEELFYQSHVLKLEPLNLDRSFTGELSVQCGLLQRKLLSTSDVITTKLLIMQLRGQFSQQNLCALNKRWEMPRAVAIFLKGVPPQVDQETIQILLAKSSELRAVKRYKEAQMPCNAIEEHIGNYSPRLSRYLSWELLQLDLLEILDDPVYKCHPSMYRLEIVQHILGFLGTFIEREVPSDSVLLELSAAVLSNFREWDKIIDMGPRFGCFFEFSRAVSVVCKEVFSSNKGNRGTGRELWDLVLPIFSNVNTHKRTSSGVIKEPPRDYSNTSPAIMSKSQLQQFIRKLKDTSSLSVIISCLAKFYNILKDDSIGEIFLDYPGLWAATVANSAAYNMSAVAETFQATLHHALSIHPTHSAWLRTKGDVMYVQGHYSASLKYYLSAAMVSTDYFYQPLPKVLFDDLMFKHMIHCCTKLHNHTQAAVLHQFLEESNYPGAFKALGERVCNDSCDTYYECIWDVTLLEYLINLHSRRGDLSYRNFVMQLVGQLELNSNNNEEIQREAANIRRGRFLRSMAKQFL